MKCSLRELFFTRPAAFNEGSLVSGVRFPNIWQETFHSGHLKLFHLGCTLVARAIRKIEVADIFVFFALSRRFRLLPINLPS